MDDSNERSVAEMEATLSRLKENLEEIKEERMFVLSQTGLHVPGGKVRQYEDEINVLQKQIEDIETVIRKNKE